jgi:hypothetical protein
LLLFGAFSLSSLACGGPATDRRSADVPGAASRLRYQNADHLSAVGEGTTQAEADRAARVGVAEQIAARLQSVCRVSDAEGGAGPAHTSACDVRSETRFDRAELITLVPAERRCLRPGHCVAFAVLDRAHALAMLSAEHTAALARFDAAALRAEGQAGAARPDDRALTTALSDAAEALARAEGQVGPLAAIEGRLPLSQSAARRRAAALDGLRDHRLSQLQVQLVLGDLDPTLRAPVAQALVQAFAALGLTARTADACEGGLSFAPVAEIPCGRSPLGPRCTLALQGALRTCGGEGLSQIDLGAGVQAVHPRSAEEARRQLLAAIPAGPLALALHRALAAVLPVRPAP